MLRNQNLKHRNDMHGKNKNIAKEKLFISSPQIEDDGVHRCRCYKGPNKWMSINVPTCFE